MSDILRSGLRDNFKINGQGTEYVMFIRVSEYCLMW